MTWHLPDEVVIAYADGRVSDPDAWSVEAHLNTCERCRTQVARVPVADTVTDRVWAAMTSELPLQGRVSPGTRWREAWVLATSGPAARWAWLAACVIVLATATALGATASGNHPPWLGMLAPLLPVIGVAASYGSGLDDAYEVIAATPGGGLRLVLVRTAVVLATTIPLALLAGVVAGYGSPAPWLLASLALTVSTLALGSLVGTERAAALVGVCWVAPISVNIANSLAVPVTLSPEAAPVWIAVTVIGAAVVFTRHESFNELRLPVRTRNEVS